ncbi:MAG: holo-ACP synthase [Burkholderiaceae bacterium]
MIYGVGTDLCDVRRIAAVLQRKGERFAERVLGPDELTVFHARRAKVEGRGLRFLATRFSAKEAFSKAIGLGLRAPMTWRHCEILNERGGKPAILLHGALKAWFDERRLVAHVTVTDEADYVATFVVVETQAGEGAPSAAARADNPIQGD